MFWNLNDQTCMMCFTPRGRLLLPRLALTRTNSDFPSLLCVDLAGSRTPSLLVRKNPPSQWEPLRRRSHPNQLLSDGSPQPQTSCKRNSKRYQACVVVQQVPDDTCGYIQLYLQTDFHQLIQFSAAALIQVSAACMALVHQVSQDLYGIGTFRVTHALKLQHTCSFAVHVLGSLVQFEMHH